MADPIDIAADAGLKSLARDGSVLSRTARGAGWVVGWRFVNRVLGLISTLILVRLLAPSAFGIVALSMNLMFSLAQLSEVGIQGAIIRNERPDRELYDTGFTINAIRGFGTGVVIAACAIPIARFFNNPEMVNVLYVVAIGSAVSSLENIGVVDFRRFIAFDKEFQFKLMPRLISVVAGVVLAFWLRNYWALVFAILINQVATVVMSYLIHPYRPGLTLSGWRRISGYSAMIWLINLVGVAQSATSNIVIGRVSGAADVGIYGVGAEIASLPSSELIGPLCRAAFSGFSEAKQNGDNGGMMMLRLLGLMALITVPAGFGLSLVAFPIVKLGFGAKWLGAVPLLEIFGIATTVTIFGSIAGTLFAVQAWLKTSLKLDIGLTVLRVGLLIGLVPRYGLIGAAIAVSIIDVVTQIVYFMVMTRRLQVSVVAIFARVWRTLIGAGVMTVVLLVAHLGWGPWAGRDAILAAHLVGAVALGAASFGVTVLLLWLASGRPDGAEADLLLALSRFRQS
ncbi:MAG: oligosaccharide flippase family protein [Acidiphilium sp.]|nr:oligosaccharide flippase family protein [Acidiphilium sp.]MDD4936325.1 oligosaccharide flippase family protein [Acidiphilium sp.]